MSLRQQSAVVTWHREARQRSAVRLEMAVSEARAALRSVPPMGERVLPQRYAELCGRLEGALAAVLLALGDDAQQR
jgi:hypothetical protein